MAGETLVIGNGSAAPKSSASLYILDTNILIHYARRDDLQAKIEAKYSLLMQPQKPLVSYVTVAELRSFAGQRKWEKAKLDQLGFLLTAFTVVPIEMPEIIEAYVEIDIYSNTLGRDMGKNDLWIAATARATAATLLTTDRDFEHLSGSFINLEWINPNFESEVGSGGAAA